MNRRGFPKKYRHELKKGNRGREKHTQARRRGTRIREERPNTSAKQNGDDSCDLGGKQKELHETEITRMRNDDERKIAARLLCPHPSPM